MTRLFGLAALALLVSCSSDFIQVHNKKQDRPPVVEKKKPVFRPKNQLGHQQALLGVQFQKIGPLDQFPNLQGQYGVKVVRVVFDSAADKAGLRAGDIIFGYDGQTFAQVEPGKVQSTFRNYIKKQKKVGQKMVLRLVRTESLMSGEVAGQSTTPEIFAGSKISQWVKSMPAGDSVNLKVQKKVMFLQKEVVLQAHRYFLSRAPKENKDLFPDYQEKISDYEKLVLHLIQQQEQQEPYQDLLSRLIDDQWWDDGLRLQRIRYIHRDPLKLPMVSEEITEDLAKSFSNDKNKLLSLVSRATDLLDAQHSKPVVIFTAPTSHDLEEHLQYIEKLIKQAHDYRYLAFSNISEEDQKFLYQKSVGLADKFLSLSWKAGADPKDFQAYEKILHLATKVRYADLLRSAEVLSALGDSEWLSRLKKSIEIYDKAHPSSLGKRGRLILNRETPWGTLVIGSQESNEYKGDYPFIIDLGGDDFYRNNAGGARSAKSQVSFLIDFSGNDIYAATDQFSQGSGYLGVGLLIDLQGHDDYWSARLAQGLGYLGIGVLWDQQGDDAYQGQEFHQGFGLWGVGLLIDDEGDDVYRATLFSQGVGSAKAVGLLLDGKGDDQYVATGEFKSSYGQRGIYTGYSQGFGIGVRQYTSGGLGILLDLKGKDVFKAGNFSQGGGYYYGMGILKNAGSENDLYVGSRYAQGFMAHSAIGILIDDGGDDVYRTHVGAAQSAAWDKGVAALIDKSGNDRYLARFLSFSQGAAAHNGLSLFFDLQGQDEYQFVAKGQGRVSSNSYHDGYSFAFFVDAGGAVDKYDQDKSNNQVWFRDEYGFFLDLKSRLEDSGLKHEVRARD